MNPFNDVQFHFSSRISPILPSPLYPLLYVLLVELDTSYDLLRDHRRGVDLVGSQRKEVPSHLQGGPA